MNAKFTENTDGRWSYRVFNGGEAVYSSKAFNTALQARMDSEDRFGRLEGEFHGDE